MRDEPRSNRPATGIARSAPSGAASSPRVSVRRNRRPRSRAWVAAVAGFALVLASCRSLPKRSETPPAPGAHAWFFLESPAPGGLPVVLPESGVRFAVEARPVLSEDDVTDVAVSTDGLGPALVFTLTPDASRRLTAALASRPDSRLVLTVNAVPVGARRIHAVPADGRISLLIEEPDAAIPRLVRDLQSTAAQWQRASRQ